MYSDYVYCKTELSTPAPPTILITAKFSLHRVSLAQTKLSCGFKQIVLLTEINRFLEHAISTSEEKVYICASIFLSTLV